MENSIIIAPGYPHNLLGHIRRLIKDFDMSFLVDNSSMMSEYRKEYPEDSNGIFELNTAYKLGMISEMAGILNDPLWRKRTFINKYAILLMRENGFKERQMVELIETFMQIFGWDFEIEVMRRWKTTEEDKADFHSNSLVDGSNKNTFLNERNREDDFRGQSRDMKEAGSFVRTPITNSRINNNVFFESEDMLTKAVNESFLSQGSSKRFSEESLRKAVLEGNGVNQFDGNTNNDLINNRYSNKFDDFYDVNEVFDTMSQKEFIQNEILKNGIKFERLMSGTVKKDVDKAIKGNSDAQFRIASFYAIPNTAHTDYIEAAKWYKMSASLGNNKAQFELGMLYDSGKVKCEDCKKTAINCYLGLAESGFPTAQCTMGLKYRFGDGVEENQEEAVKWFKKAAVQGHVDAQRNLGDMYLGVGNNETAKYWFQRAGSLGDSYSQKQFERLS